MDKNITDNELFQELMPLFLSFIKSERYSVTLGGSHGKSVSDSRSDYDFRVYSDEFVKGDRWSRASDELNKKVSELKDKGILVDDTWFRSIGDTDDIIRQWVSGGGAPIPFVWCVWGYHMLTDIFNQLIIDDSFGIAFKWKEELSIYPAKLQSAVIAKHSASMKYWRNDYHFKSKVERADYVFLSSLTVRLIHDIFQVIYALNRCYYPGDGNNMLYVKDFLILPIDFEKRIVDVLYPNNANTDMFMKQYSKLISLIDDTLLLCA